MVCLNFAFADVGHVDGRKAGTLILLGSCHICGDLVDMLLCMLGLWISVAKSVISPNRGSSGYLTNSSWYYRNDRSFATDQS